jgi:hypothetical protein
MAQSVDNEVKTMIYFNGVYQFKGTYTVNGTLITFDTAPSNGVNIEVISIASAAAGEEAYSQELLFYGKASGAISKGDAVMFAGSEGDHFLFARATQAAIEANHEYLIGLATQDLANNEYGYITEFGNISSLDTSGYTAGDILWFDAGGTTAGALTTTEPAAPLAKIQVAAVIRSHQNQGVIFVRPTWFHSLDELHDVNITSIADKDLLVWDNANGYWENSKTVDTLTANTLSATTLTGTLSTAAQTNITSVGTLTSLNVNGDIRVNGTKILSTISSASYIWNNTDSLYVVDDTGNTVQLSIKDSGNIGINTSSPDSILHLHGDTQAWITSPTIIMSSSNTGNANVRNWRIGPADTNFGNFHIGVSDIQGGIVDSNSEASTFTIDYQGKVGIGTISPAAKLHVEIDTASETDVARFRTINGADNHFLDISVDNTNNLVAYDSSGASSGDHVFRTGGAERMRVTSSGQLQLPYGNASALNGGEGVITDPGTFTGMKLYGSSDGNLKIFNVRNNSSFGNILFYTGAGVERFRIDNNGTLQITESSANGYINGNGTDLEIDVNRHPETGAFSDATKGHARIALRAEDSGAGSRIIFSTASTANTPGTERMRINSTGNVGIGTTSPSEKLEVNGTIASITSSYPTIKVQGSDVNYQGRMRWDTNNNVLEFLTRHAGTYYGDTLVLSEGKVGVGTNVPQQTLHANGNVQIGTNSNQYIKFHTGTNWYYYLKATNDDFFIEDAQGLRFFTAAYNGGTTSKFASILNHLYVINNGNVGIGTSSPDKKLEIKTGSTATGVHYLQTIGGAYHTTGYAVGLGLDPEGYGNRNKIGIVAEGIGTGWSRGKLHFLLRGETGVSGEADLSHSRMVITDDTKVGIGTTTPDDGLHIYGVGNGNGVKIEATSGNYESAVLKLYPKSPNADERNWAIAAYKDSADDLSFSSSNVKGGNPYSSGTTRMIIEGTTGNVGINKTNPDYTLDVEGQVAFTDVILARSGTSSLTNADYWYQGKFTGSGSVHLKTSIGWGANTQMYSFHFLGHEYGQSKPIDAMLCFYNYPPQSTPISIGTSGTHSISIYQSSDGYIVFRLALGSGYYTGFTISSRNTAQGLAYPSIIATAQNTSATHF